MKKLFFSFVALIAFVTTGLGFSTPAGAQGANFQLNGNLANPEPEDPGDPPAPQLDFEITSELTVCTDGIDNDGDGNADADDLGCYTNPYSIGELGGGKFDPNSNTEVSCTDSNFAEWIFMDGDWWYTAGSCNEHWASCTEYIESPELFAFTPEKCLNEEPPKVCYDYDGQFEEVPCPSDPFDPGGPGGLTNPDPGADPHPYFTINVPQENAVMDKDDAYTVSGLCTENYHVFISANNTKNPAYVKCSNNGTYSISDLQWLDTVQPGSSQLISGKQVDIEGKLGGTDEVNVQIMKEATLCIDCINGKPECSDGIDNDGDGKSDADDPGCWIDGNYDPNDPDEGDDPDLPECSDNDDNDNDGKIDSEDPGCWIDGNYDPNDPDEGDDPTTPECSDGVDNADEEDDLADALDPGCWLIPGDPTTYDPNDPNEEDEPTRPECVDGVDNADQEDELADALDPGCWSIPGNPETYDPNDPDEGDVPTLPECSDGIDNDNDGKADALDPGCWSIPGNPETYDPNDPNEEDEPNGGPIFTIDLPTEGQVMQKEALYNVSGKCEPGYHVFIGANNTKNPAYALCSGQGTYTASNLKWLDSVQKGSNQVINGHQIDLNDQLAGNDQVNVVIADDDNCVPNEVDDCIPDQPECSDGIDNDNDGKADALDPGCWLIPGDPTTYDPNDPNEEDEPNLPECSDDADNDGDNKADELDPGCHTDGDPNNPGTFDPNDPNEEDEPGNNPDDDPVCSDGKDNDNDGKVDANDPGCWDDPNDPDTYDPNDPNETDDPKPECSDGINNDNDQVIDANDPGCWEDPGDPGTYDPNDPNEGDEPACADNKDNDNDGKADELDPGCWTDPNDPDTYDPNDPNENDPNDPGDDDGSVPYNPGEDYFNNDQCLDYNELRKLIFKDVNNLNEEGARAAIALKNTRLVVNGKFSQYILSGYGGDLDETGETVIGLNQTLQRIEGGKIFLISHCLPVLDEDTIPDVRSNGDPMISYHDLPRSGAAPSTMVQNIAYTLQYFTGSKDSFMRGTDEGNFEPYRAFTVEEFMKPLTMIQEFRKGAESGKDYAAVAGVSKRWSYEFYARAAYQDLLEYIPNALSQPTKPLLRKHAFDTLVHAMLQRDLYTNEDEVKVKGVLNEQ